MFQAIQLQLEVVDAVSHHTSPSSHGLSLAQNISVVVDTVATIQNEFVRNESTFEADGSKCTRLILGVLFLFLVDLRSFSTT